MFGYVYIDKPELKVKSYELYRGVYCSLCKTLGKEYSPLARFILNYDCTFLSLLILSRNKACNGFKQGRCPFNITKRCSYVQTETDAMKKGAALTVITAYYKLLDNIADECFFKKGFFYSLKPIFSLWHKKAAAAYPQYEQAVSDMFYAQLACEASSEVCIDMAAEPTAKMIETVLSLEGETEAQKSALAQMGYHMGKWIYLMDGANDMDDDMKKGKFNPFLIEGKSSEKVDIKRISALLSQSYYLLTKAYELIDKNRFADILDNIIYSGMYKKQTNILNPERKS